MEYKTLTVIIPNYNKEKYLEYCINSVIGQTRVPDEIIIVDDCSSDSSREIITRLASNHDCIKPIFLEKNKGVSNARNVGLVNASSEYVSFIDADDYYYNPKKLENEMNLIQMYAYRAKDIAAYSHTVRVDVNNEVLYKTKISESTTVHGKILYSLLAEQKAGNEPRDYCVKKSIIMDVGAYSFPKNHFEDLDLLIRLSSKINFENTGDYGTAYRDTPGGLSKKTVDEQCTQVAAIRKNYYQRLKPFEKIKVKCLRYYWKFFVLMQRAIKKCNMKKTMV